MTAKQLVDDSIKLLEHIGNTNEIIFYDDRTKTTFKNSGLVNFIRLYGFIPGSLRVITGEKEMAKTIKKKAAAPKAAKPTKKDGAKKPASKPAKKS